MRIKYIILTFAIWPLLASCLYAQKALVVKKDATTQNINVANFENIENYKKIEFENYTTSSPYEVYHKNDKWFVISRSNFEVIVYNKDFKSELYKIGKLGRGPGEGKFIHGYEITNNYIYLYDSNLRKFTVFNQNGGIEFEKLNDDQNIPYLINDLIHINKDMFLATGINNKGYSLLNKGAPYENIFLLKINKSGINLLDAKNLHAENISNGIINFDIISSTITSPYRFSTSKKGIFIRNQNSNQVFKVNVNNNAINLSTVYYLEDEVFKLHPKVKESEFSRSSKLREEWRLNGNFFIDIYENNNSIFFYLSSFNNKSKQIEYTLNVYNKNKELITHIINISDFEIIRNIDDNSIYTVTYNSKDDNYIYGEIDISALIK